MLLHEYKMKFKVFCMKMSISFSYYERLIITIIYGQKNKILGIAVYIVLDYIVNQKSIYVVDN